MSSTMIEEKRVVQKFFSEIFGIDRFETVIMETQSDKQLKTAIKLRDNSYVIIGRLSIKVSNEQYNQHLISDHFIGAEKGLISYTVNCENTNDDFKCGNHVVTHFAFNIYFTSMPQLLILFDGLINELSVIDHTLSCIWWYTLEDIECIQEEKMVKIKISHGCWTLVSQINYFIDESTTMYHELPTVSIPIVNMLHGFNEVGERLPETSELKHIVRSFLGSTETNYSTHAVKWASKLLQNFFHRNNAENDVTDVHRWLSCTLPDKQMAEILRQAISYEIHELSRRTEENNEHPNNPTTKLDFYTCEEAEDPGKRANCYGLTIVNALRKLVQFIKRNNMRVIVVSLSEETHNKVYSLLMSTDPKKRSEHQLTCHTPIFVTTPGRWNVTHGIRKLDQYVGSEEGPRQGRGWEEMVQPSTTGPRLWRGWEEPLTQTLTTGPRQGRGWEEMASPLMTGPGSPQGEGLGGERSSTTGPNQYRFNIVIEVGNNNETGLDKSVVDEMIQKEFHDSSFVFSWDSVSFGSSQDRAPSLARANDDFRLSNVCHKTPRGIEFSHELLRKGFIVDPLLIWMTSRVERIFSDCSMKDFGITLAMIRLSIQAYKMIYEPAHLIQVDALTFLPVELRRLIAKRMNFFY